MFNFFRKKDKSKPDAALTQDELKQPQESVPSAENETGQDVVFAPVDAAVELATPTEIEPKIPTLDEVKPEVKAEVETDKIQPISTIESQIVTENSADQPQKQGWFARLKAQLGKTRKTFADGLANLVLGKKEIDQDLLDDLEMLLISADVGIEATDQIIQHLTRQVSRKELKDPKALVDSLKLQLRDLLQPVNKPLDLSGQAGPYVILMVGVNGVGKTTTIGKLAMKFKQEGKSVMLAAGDTFRAAAVEQLQTWGERNNVPVISQGSGADSAAVIFDAIQSAKAKGIDVLIADTAGRLHTQNNLMEELKKVKRVMAKVDANAPHEVMLVIDAGTGQNALNQATQFHQAVGLTGLTLTKLDGTAKGGIVFSLAQRLGIPIRFIGVGETLHDLRPFDANEFIEALFSDANN